MYISFSIELLESEGYQMSIGDIIVALRTKQGMNQTEFAKKTNISRSVMNRIRN